MAMAAAKGGKKCDLSTTRLRTDCFKVGIDFDCHRRELLYALKNRYVSRALA
jgi:hypothetical protein